MLLLLCTLVQPRLMIFSQDTHNNMEVVSLQALSLFLMCDVLAGLHSCSASRTTLGYRHGGHIQEGETGSLGRGRDGWGRACSKTMRALHCTRILLLFEQNHSHCAA